MTVPPNMVSDTRLAWNVERLAHGQCGDSIEELASLRELQARRAADKTREPSPDVVEALRECRSAIETVVSTGNVSGPFRRHVLPVLGMIQKALAAHDARPPQGIGQHITLASSRAPGEQTARVRVPRCPSPPADTTKE